MPTLPDDERRVTGDRRHSPTSVWSTLLGVGRRTSQRRSDEDQQPYFVDRFSHRTLAIILTFLMLSLFDGAITIHLVGLGYHEINPIMARLLEWGALPFLVGKYVLTAAGLPVLLVFKNFTLFRTRFRVGSLLPVLLLAYVVLLAYQIGLLRAHGGL